MRRSRRGLKGLPAHGFACPEAPVPLGSGEPLAEYARFWLRDTALRIGTPFLLATTAEHIHAIESGRPGFAAHLRHAALAALSGGDAVTIGNAVGVLAVVGTVADVQRILAAGREGNGVLARDSRTAAFEIESRSRAG